MSAAESSAETDFVRAKTEEENRMAEISQRLVAGDISETFSSSG